MGDPFYGIHKITTSPPASRLDEQKVFSTKFLPSVRFYEEFDLTNQVDVMNNCFFVSMKNLLPIQPFL